MAILSLQTLDNILDKQKKNYRVHTSYSSKGNEIIETMTSFSGLIRV